MFEQKTLLKSVWLPGSTCQVVQKLPALNTEFLDNGNCGDSFHDPAERAMCVQAGMVGRAWFGQALVYDEIYGFLQDLSILDKPNEKKAAESASSGQTPLAGWFTGRMVGLFTEVQVRPALGAGGQEGPPSPRRGVECVPSTPSPRGSSCASFPLPAVALERARPCMWGVRLPVLTVADAVDAPPARRFNRLVQFGKSDHETKSNGSHGGPCLGFALDLFAMAARQEAASRSLAPLGVAVGIWRTFSKAVRSGCVRRRQFYNAFSD